MFVYVWMWVYVHKFMHIYSYIYTYIHIYIYIYIYVCVCVCVNTDIFIQSIIKNYWDWIFDLILKSRIQMKACERLNILYQEEKMSKLKIQGLEKFKQLNTNYLMMI